MDNATAAARAAARNNWNKGNRQLSSTSGTVVTTHTNGVSSARRHRQVRDDRIVVLAATIGGTVSAARDLGQRSAGASVDRHRGVIRANKASREGRSAALGWGVLHPHIVLRRLPVQECARAESVEGNRIRAWSRGGCVERSGCSGSGNYSRRALILRHRH